MTHHGNVTKINGAEVEPVDIITFGAPCQDLSVAGKRSGLKHVALGDDETTRSGLFFEAIRIIKEMREATNGTHPRFAIYENVPGAFSSNKGNDFHAVLEALCSVCDDTVSIPRPYDKRKPDKLVWNGAGEIVGGNYSVAWRTLDAQYWGVPQRRKRIYLVADFTSGCAGEILFKPDSLRGDFTQGDEAGQGAAADAVGSVDGSNGNGGQLAATLISSYGTKWNGNAGAYNGENFVLQKHSVDGSVGVECLNPWDTQGIRQYSANGVYPALSSNATGGQNRQGVVFAAGFCQGVSPAAQTIGYQAEIAPTVKGAPSGTAQVSAVVVVQDGSETARTLAARYDSSPCADRGQNVVCYDMAEQCNTIDCMHDKQAVLTTGKPPRKYIIRRLTPTECARLQGFPDDWGHLAPFDPADAEFWEGVRKTHAEINGKKYKPVKDIKKWYDKLHTDSAEYKMWGNGIALPNAEYVLHGIAEQGAKTLGSLFDGSGGFPLAGALSGIEPLWASEVEPYCIAVTTCRFKKPR